MKTISLIVPAKNEEGNIPHLEQEITELRKELLNYKFEILLIDNCSQDRTGELVREICGRDRDWKYIRFTRDFGSEVSIAAGLRLCTGDAAIILFSDLQDPPSEIPRFARKWEEGFQIVYGIYHGRDHEKLWKRFLVKQYYRILCRISDPPLVPFAGDFRLYDRKVVRVMNELRERNRYMRGLAQWVGFRTCPLEYERQPRAPESQKHRFFICSASLSMWWSIFPTSR